MAETKETSIKTPFEDAIFKKNVKSSGGTADTTKAPSDTGGKELWIGKGKKV